MTTTTRRRPATGYSSGGWTQGWVAPSEREACEPCKGTGKYNHFIDHSTPAYAWKCGACHGRGYWRKRGR